MVSLFIASRFPFIFTMFNPILFYVKIITLGIFNQVQAQQDSRGGGGTKEITTDYIQL